jgi:hypothetical protein
MGIVGDSKPRNPAENRPGGVKSEPCVCSFLNDRQMSLPCRAIPRYSRVLEMPRGSLFSADPDTAVPACGDLT